MIDRARLADALARYKQDFLKFQWKNEQYKWTAVKNFQDNWNVEEPDFAQMLARSLSKTYVKNRDALFGAEPHQVSGMLLYARTDERIQPDNVYQMSGNPISVKTLDLNRPFPEIAGQLNRIVAEHFG